MKNFMKLLIEYLEGYMDVVLIIIVVLCLIVGSIFLPIVRIVSAVILLVLGAAWIVACICIFVDMIARSKISVSRRRYLESSRDYSYFREYFEDMINLIVNVFFTIFLIGLAGAFVYFTVIDKGFWPALQSALYSGF